MLTSKCRLWVWWWETITQHVELADLADIILLLKELSTWTDPIRHLKTCLKWERRQCPGLEEIEGFLWNRKQTPPPPSPTPTPHRHDGYTITISETKTITFTLIFITSRQNSQYHLIWWWNTKSCTLFASADTLFKKMRSLLSPPVIPLSNPFCHAVPSLSDVINSYENSTMESPKNDSYLLPSPVTLSCQCSVCVGLWTINNNPAHWTCRCSRHYCCWANS